jgi:hypothetical protein
LPRGLETFGWKSDFMLGESFCVPQPFYQNQGVNFSLAKRAAKGDNFLLFKKDKITKIKVSTLNLGRMSSLANLFAWRSHFACHRHFAWRSHFERRSRLRAAGT